MVMVVRVLFTLRATGFADIGAEPAEFVPELGAPRLQPSAQGADIGAVAAELGAKGHFFADLNVGRGAVFAGGEAGEAGLNTILVLVMHGHVYLVKKWLEGGYI